MDGRNIDPAALMLAAVGATLGPMTGSGRWGPINTLIFPFVAAIILAYVWSPKRSLPLATAVAFCAAMTLVLANVFAWPLQLLIDQWHPLRPSCDEVDGGVRCVAESVWRDNSLSASIAAIVVGLAVVGVLTFFRLLQRSSASTDDEHSVQRSALLE